MTNLRAAVLVRFFHQPFSLCKKPAQAFDDFIAFCDGHADQEDFNLGSCQLRCVVSGRHLGPNMRKLTMHEIFVQADAVLIAGKADQMEDETLARKFLVVLKVFFFSDVFSGQRYRGLKGLCGSLKLRLRGDGYLPKSMPHALPPPYSLSKNGSSGSKAKKTKERIMKKPAASAALKKPACKK